MKWVKEPPSEPGFYWAILKAVGSPEIVQIPEDDDGWIRTTSDDSVRTYEVARWWPVRIEEPPKDSC